MENRDRWKFEQHRDTRLTDSRTSWMLITRQIETKLHHVLDQTGLLESDNICRAQLCILLAWVWTESNIKALQSEFECH